MISLFPAKKLDNYTAEVLADNPIIYWRNDEASGLSEADSSGNGHVGTISSAGITYRTTGVLFADTNNTAFTFDGTAGEIHTATSLSLAPYSALTIEFWLKVTAFNNSDKLLLETSVDSAANNGSLLINPNAAAGNIQLHALDTIGNANKSTFARPSAGAYHHYALILRTGKTSGAWTARIDKVDQAMTDTASVTISAFGNFTMYLASRAGTSQFIAGSIDEFAIYGTALSVGRTDKHYDEAVALSPKLRPTVQRALVSVGRY